MRTLILFTLFALLSVTFAIRRARATRSTDGPTPAPTRALTTAAKIMATLSNATLSTQRSTTGTPLKRGDDKGNTQRWTSEGQTPVHTLAATTATAAKLFALLSNTTASSQGNTTANPRKTGGVDDQRRLIKMTVSTPGTTTVPTNAAPAQIPVSNTTVPSRRNTTAPCVDVYIWYADGATFCDALYTPSTSGFNQNPDYWCNKYILTDCCATCARLRAERVIS